MCREYLNAIDKKTQNYFKKNIINNINFPFYLNKTEIENKINNFCFFTHIILHRPEDNLPNSSQDYRRICGTNVCCRKSCRCTRFPLTFGDPFPCQLSNVAGPVPC